jgi:TonB-linked SusC/RagA family outer membrane protein
MKLSLIRFVLFCGTLLLTCSVKAAPGKTTTDPCHANWLAQKYTGTVFDNTNSPVAGALVKVVGTSITATTDQSGLFTIEANAGATIIITKTGFKDKEYVLGEDVSFSLALDYEYTLVPLKSPQPVQLLYTTVPQRLSVASADAVYNNDLMKSPVTSFGNALAGRMAGLFTIQNSGLPGSDGASFNLRGQAPLVIVDGVVTGLTQYDLEEIESVTVLKDASAIAMLGVRGSNGAIVVTTKKGIEGKPQVSLTAQTAFQQPLGYPKAVNAYDYARLRNEALRNDGIDSVNSGLYYSQTALDAYKNHSDPYNYPDVNYWKEITKNSSMLNRYTLSTRGGGKFAKYFVAVEHVNQSGFFKTVDSNTYNTNNNFKSYVIRSNVDVNITPKLTGGIYLLGRIQNANEPGASTGSILSSLLVTPANAYPVLNQNGSFGGSQIYQNNIWAQTVASGYRQTYKRDVLVNVYLKRTLNELLPGLYTKAKVAYYGSLSESIYRTKSFAVFQKNGASSYAQFGANGTQGNSNGIDYQSRLDYEEFSLGYDKTINADHGINAIVLVNRDNSSNGYDLPLTITGTSGRVAYNYKGRYMLEGSWGYNGSNRYPDNGKTKRGLFSAIGLGWNIDQEAFMANVPFVSALKLYGSYGKTGWDKPGYFTYYPRFYDGPGYFYGTSTGGVTTITEGVLANPNITFEKANKLNIGLNGSLLKNQLSFKVEYYRNKYYDIVMQRGPNSTLLGNDYPNENIGQNRYFGWEGQLTWQQTSNKWQYFIAANVSTIGSEVLYANEVDWPYDWMKRTGQPVTQSFGYIADGLYQSQDDINSHATTVGYKPQLGDIKYKDLNEDGVIDQNDQAAMGTTKPLFFYGISFGVTWKGFDISAVLQGVQNYQVYLAGSSYRAFPSNGLGQAWAENLGRWTPDNAAGATYPRLSYGGNTNNYATSSYWLRKNNFIRLKNAEIGYSLPQSLIRKIRLQTIRVFANGYNLLTWASADFSDRDPESYSGGYPVQRLVNFGINIKF